MILIMALALIVVGPDKLPDLARSLAKGLMELKKTAEGLKDTLSAEGNPLDEIRPDLEEAARSLKSNLLETPPYLRDEKVEPGGVNPPSENIMAAYGELMKNSTIEDTDLPVDSTDATQSPAEIDKDGKQTQPINDKDKNDSKNLSPLQ